MEGNNAPFAIGQRVIALEDGCYMESDGRIVKNFSEGDVFTVLDLWFCCKWRVDIGFRHPVEAPECFHCKQTNGLINWAPAAMFAPIQHQYKDISKEIMEKFPLTEEVPDKALVPETVNN